MNADALIRRLEAGAGALRGLADGVPAEQAVWKPAPGRWSILEVAGHLLDEERFDFRVRIDLVLTDPEREWPPIDPEGWVAAHRYAERDLEETMRAFAEERARSVAFLRGLRSPRWEQGRRHPVAGLLTAGDLLASWVAHDLLHARQLARLHYDHVRHLAGDRSVAYAGSW